MMGEVTNEQIFHINKMFLEGALSRAQFGEFNRMALAGQVTEEVVQLISEGRFEFQNRLSDAHLTKVRIVWERLGRQVFGGTFETYLNGTDALEPIPLPPSWPSEYLDAFDREVFVDGRIVEKIGLVETCKLAGVAYFGLDHTFFESTRTKTGVRWMRGQAGRKNLNRTPNDCRRTFEKYEVGMAADEGVFTYVNDARVILGVTVTEGGYLDLPGSVHREYRGECAYLGVIGCRVRLGWRWSDRSNPWFGSASRGE